MNYKFVKSLFSFKIFIFAFFVATPLMAEQPNYSSRDIIDFIQKTSKAIITFVRCNDEQKKCGQHNNEYTLVLEPKKRMSTYISSPKFPDLASFRSIHEFSKGSSGSKNMLQNSFNSLPEKLKKYSKSLASANFYKGKIDGIWGPGTSNA